MTGPARRPLPGVRVPLAAPGAAGMEPRLSLTHAPRWRAFDLVYDADFAGADAALKQACGPAPAQACAVIGAAAAWWRIYLDIDNRASDRAFRTRLDAVIADGERWAAREPARAEAWFYLGAAYGVRVQFHGQRLEFAAARDGKQIRSRWRRLSHSTRARRSRRARPVSVLRRCARRSRRCSAGSRAAGRRQGAGPAELRRARERHALKAGRPTSSIS
jgi:hypothetical protein